VSVGERLVTVLVTVAVPGPADPEDAAGLVAGAAACSALEVVHAVGVEGHLPLAGRVVTTPAGVPAVVVTVGEGSVVLRHLDGGVQQASFNGLVPDLLDSARGRPTTGRRRRRATDIHHCPVAPTI